MKVSVIFKLFFIFLVFLFLSNYFSFFYLLKKKIKQLIKNIIS